MPKLVKRFTTRDLLTHNRSVCNPSFLINDRLIVYRDGRDENKDDNTKLLKIGNIDSNLNVSNCNTIHIIGKDLSDPRLFKWGDNVYVVVTIITLYKHKSYDAAIDLLDLRTNSLLGLTYEDAEEKEKNWIFFEHDNELLCSRSLADGEHQVLKFDQNKMKDYVISTYRTGWPDRFGKVRNTSNYAYHDGLMWGCIHSHDGEVTMPATYRCGLFAFELKFPYQIVKMSNVPLFRSRYKGDILYPNHLDIVDGNFRIGVGVKEIDHFDIITVSYDEVKDHLERNISFNYID